MEIGDVLTSKPLRTLDIEISPEYEAICKGWLAKQGCTCDNIQEGWYRVGFPAGTVVQDRLGQSGYFTRKQFIVFPDKDKTEITLLIASPINSEQKEHVSIGFPDHIFPEPE